MNCDLLFQAFVGIFIKHLQASQVAPGEGGDLEG